jgi:hypothetical protein
MDEMVAYINNDAATLPGTLSLSFINSNGLPRLKRQDNAKVVLKIETGRRWV